MISAAWFPKRFPSQLIPAPKEKRGACSGNRPSFPADSRNCSKWRRWAVTAPAYRLASGIQRLAALPALAASTGLGNGARRLGGRANTEADILQRLGKLACPPGVCASHASAGRRGDGRITRFWLFVWFRKRVSGRSLPPGGERNLRWRASVARSAGWSQRRQASAPASLAATAGSRLCRNGITKGHGSPLLTCCCIGIAQTCRLPCWNTLLMLPIRHSPPAATELLLERASSELFSVH